MPRPIVPLDKLATCLRCRRIVIVHMTPGILTPRYYNPEVWDQFSILKAMGTYMHPLATPAGAYHYNCMQRAPL